MSGDIYSLFYKSKEWFKVRAQVLSLALYRCCVCGRDVRGKGNSRVDHIVPLRVDWSKRLDKSNLRVLCPSCDNKRHSEKNSNVEKLEIDQNGFPPDWR